MISAGREVRTSETVDCGRVGEGEEKDMLMMEEALDLACHSLQKLGRFRSVDMCVCGYNRSLACGARIARTMALQSWTKYALCVRTERDVKFILSLVLRVLSVPLLQTFPSAQLELVLEVRSIHRGIWHRQGD